MGSLKGRIAGVPKDARGALPLAAGDHVRSRCVLVLPLPAGDYPRLLVEDPRKDRRLVDVADDGAALLLEGNPQAGLFNGREELLIEWMEAKLHAVRDGGSSVLVGGNRDIHAQSGDHVVGHGSLDDALCVAGVGGVLGGLRRQRSPRDGVAQDLMNHPEVVLDVDRQDAVDGRPLRPAAVDLSAHEELAAEEDHHPRPVSQEVRGRLVISLDLQ